MVIVSLDFVVELGVEGLWMFFWEGHDLVVGFVGDLIEYASAE